MTRTRTVKLLGATLAMAGVLAMPAAVSAQTDRAVPDERPTTAPEIERLPAIELLHMKCRQVEPGVAAVECAWRKAGYSPAVGYQLWRVIDRGERELVWRGGLGTTSNVSRVPKDATVARYALLAVTKHGHIVGRSRVQTIRLRLEHDRPTDVRPTAVAPTDVKPVDVRPVDTRPTDVKPTDVRPTEIRPADARPTEIRPVDRPTVRQADFRPVRRPNVRRFHRIF
jgi:hypothetical protein